MNVVLLQTGFVILVLALVWLALAHGQRELYEFFSLNAQNPEIQSGVLTYSYPESLLHTSTLAGMFVIFVVIALLAGLFGFLTARITLSPNRFALDMQKKFIGNIAHELRTPLSVLKTNAEVALFTEELTDDTRELLEQNIVEYDNISATINTLLSFDHYSKSEDISFKEVDLGEIVERSALSLYKLATSRGVTLDVSSGKDLTVWGDKNALSQLCTNLIKNAIMFTPKKTDGKVAVSLAERNQQYIELRIEDTGLGIEPQDLVHIMEPFYQADSARTSRESTGGLGLALVYEIVRMHNAQIRVESSPGLGTRVTVWVPHDRRTVERRADTFVEFRQK